MVVELGKRWGRVASQALNCLTEDLGLYPEGGGDQCVDSGFPGDFQPHNVAQEGETEVLQGPTTACPRPSSKAPTCCFLTCSCHVMEEARLCGSPWKASLGE